MYKELLDAKKEKNINADFLGIWIYANNQILESSIKISILNDIKQYGLEDVSPINEFYKMTYRNNES
jgi:hypothetical protein